MPRTYRAIITIQDEVGGGGRPIDPGFGVGGGGEHPDQGLPGHGLHPDHGLPGSGGSAGQLPIWPEDAPPGTVWPPLPPHFEGDGKKAIVLAAIEGVGYRYIVVELSGGEGGEHPDQGLPDGEDGEDGGEDGGEAPDQGLPAPRPPQVGNRPPGQVAPPRPGQGLPGGPPPPAPGNRPPGSAQPPARPGQLPGQTPQPKPAGRR